MCVCIKNDKINKKSFYRYFNLQATPICISKNLNSVTIILLNISIKFSNIYISKIFILKMYFTC